MNRLYACLLLLCLAMGSACAGTVQVCADQAEMPPFVFAERVNDQRSGKVVGASVDLLKLIGARQGWNVSVQLLPWARCLALVADHRVDIALNVGQADAGSQLVLSDAYFTMHNVYFYSRRARPQGLSLQKLSDVGQYHLCGLGGYHFEVYGIPTSKVDRGATIGYEQLIGKLHLGRCDLFIDSRETMAGQYLINPKLRSLLVDGTLVSQPLPDSPLRPLYFGVAAGATGASLLHTLNDGLARLAKTRELEKLLDHYMEQ